MDVTNPAAWASFDEALAAIQPLGCAGVGFVFTPEDPFTGVDLDDCLDSNGVMSDGARAIVADLNSYTEVSPSGRGVKIFLKGAKPAGSGCRSKRVDGFKEIEVYSEARFFVVTGRHWPGTPATVEERQAPLDALCRRLWPPSAPAATGSGGGFGGDDLALIEKAKSALNGEKFASLWAGDTSGHGGDHSVADLALCGMLAFWTGGEADRMDRLFRLSGLMRAKWDEMHGQRTYGRMTIDKAIAGRGAAYEAGKPGLALGNGAGLAGADEPYPLGERDHDSGRLVLSPARTFPTAVAFVREFHTLPDGRTLHAHGGVLHVWRGNRYAAVEDAAMRHALAPWLHEAVCPVAQARGGVKLVPFGANPVTTAQALDAIRTHVHLDADMPVPSWLGEGADRPPPSEILACRSVNIHLPTGRMLPATPAYFNTSALDFDYDPSAPPPLRWHQFLDELFGSDDDGRRLLRQWFGYCLVPDTSRQKILLVVGPRRSGKGTIEKVLHRLVGIGNVAGPTVGGLAAQFGLQQLLGKSLAIISDARFQGDNVRAVTERLLCISGEGAIGVERKHLPTLTVKLPTRFVILTNELPRFADASNALAGRFLVLRLQNSFYGREDLGLVARLMAELPGILNWALEGWHDLASQGAFTEPASAGQLTEELEELGSPISAFIRERCVAGPDQRVGLDELFAAWRAWCEAKNIEHVGTVHSFGRDLRAVLPRLEVKRGTGQVRFYLGVALKAPSF